MSTDGAGEKMAWNEQGNGKNPWDRGGSNQGPPDLDKLVRDWQRRVNRMFGGRGGGRGGAGAPQSGGPAFAFIVVIVLIVWALTGIYMVDDAERGVELRFGKYTQTTTPGLRWHIPWPIEQVNKINANEVARYSKKSRMLTADENIVDVDIVVQYRRTDPVKYLFNVRDPDETLQEISESAIREIIGKNSMDFVLQEGRTEVALRTQELIQETLDEYGAGIYVERVNLQDVNFPSQVEAAVQDAIKAREDKERLAFEAESYANDILPKARGEAARRLQDAEAYKSRLIADAEGEAARFESLLVEYEKAPKVTRERLYIEAIEDVYANSAKVFIDTEGNGNLVYLPVDKLMEQRGFAPSATMQRNATGAPPAASQGSSRQRDGRSRRTR